MRIKLCLCSFLPSVLLLTALVGCVCSTPTPAPKVRDFELNELLIDASSFPSGWQQDGPVQENDYELTPRGTEENLFIQFTAPSGLWTIATHTVYRFQDNRVAAKAYRRSVSLGFYDAGRVTPWESPDWMQYQSSIADQFRFACAEFSSGYPKVRSLNCNMVGQYEEYISTFSISITSPGSVPDLDILIKQILRAIDERMALYVVRDDG